MPYAIMSMTSTGVSPATDLTLFQQETNLRTEQDDVGLLGVRLSLGLGHGPDGGLDAALLGARLHLGDHQARGHACGAAKQNVDHELSSFPSPARCGNDIARPWKCDRNILITPP